MSNRLSERPLREGAVCHIETTTVAKEMQYQRALVNGVFRSRFW